MKIVVEFAFETSVVSTILEGNSQVLMGALAEEGVPLWPPHCCVKTRFCSFLQLYYPHVKKEGNKVAYSLSKHALHFSDFNMWMEDVSLQFVHILRLI